jgi:hypothetical protein
MTGVFIFLTCMSSRGLAPPWIPVNSADYPAWRDSIHMKVGADTNSPLVMFWILLEKPKQQDFFWHLILEVHQGTNTIVRSPLRYDILDPAISARLSDPHLTNKTVQRFEFSIDRSLLNNSSIVFQELDETHKDLMGHFLVSSPWIVHVSDMCPHAESAPAKQDPQNDR